MDNEIILIDDELDHFQEVYQVQYLQQQPGPSNNNNHRQPQTARRGRGRGRKRTSDGIVVGTTAGGAVLRVHPPPVVAPPPQLEQEDSVDFVQFMSAPNVAVPVALPSGAPEVDCDSVIVDGQDVYYIQEIGEEGESQAQEEEVEQDLDEYQQAEEVPEIVGPEVDEGVAQGEEVDDFYEVEPQELSEIWNDLITANQEILILLELQDLKHHIVDARKIQEQMMGMVCEYCSRVLPEMRAWNRHIMKIHFQTKVFECDSCTSQFKQYAHFKDHLNNHSGQRLYQCDECNHQYAFQTGFLVHKILDHMKLNGIYVCPKCDLDCKNAQSYKLHIAKHIDFTSSIPSELANSHKTEAAAAAVAVPPAQQQQQKAKSAPVPFYSKENERNKFLNVFENFSREVHSGGVLGYPGAGRGKGKRKH